MRELLLALTVTLLSLQTTKAEELKKYTDFSSNDSYNSYKAATNTNKKAGKIMLILGLAMTLAGAGLYLEEALQDKTVSSAAPILFYLGAATTIISIPLLISANKNKTTAALTIKGEYAFIKTKSATQSRYPAIALRFAL